MAIEFARSHVLSRSAGHSAVKAAAYRAGERLRDERVGRIADYSSRAADVGHSEILLPAGASPELSDRQTLWEAVEHREDQHNRRASARLAVDHIIALPVELSREQHVALATEFAKNEFVSRGLVVDLAIHYHSDGNPHAHLMTTTRPLKGAVFGAKDREVDGKFYGGFKLKDAEQLRHRWTDFQNQYFKEHGINAFVVNHNGEFEAEKHLGAAHEMHKKGVETELFDKVQTIRTAREQAIIDRPEIIVNRVADKKAVFTKYDLYRELNKVVNDPSVFSAVKEKLDHHASLVKMVSATGRSFLTTLDTLAIEQSIRNSAARLSKNDKNFALKPSVIETNLRAFSFLSQEQTDAVRHLSTESRLGIVMGLAGAGKSTMLEVVRRAHEQSGHRVHGVALAGKAADELEQSSGIASRTISSFLSSVKGGFEEIAKGDVIVVDEFGMVSNAQAQQLLTIADEAGAKLIGVGDTEQLQSIQAGAVLRDLSERFGYASIETIRRQVDQWQRDATYSLAKGRTDEALAAYKDHGRLFERADAIGELVSAYLADERAGSKAVLAHRTADVKTLNEQIRDGLKAQGLLSAPVEFLAHSGRDENRIAFDLAGGEEVLFNSRDAALGLSAGDRGTFVGLDGGALSFVHEDGREISFEATRYSDIDIVDQGDTAIKIELADGDRILFTRNDRDLGVKNGQLGTLESIRGDVLRVRMDTGESLQFSQREYSDISHGYATTVHKSQGMTVDRSYVLGTNMMDKHLAYVSLSRHRESTAIYTNDEAGFMHAAARENRQETALDFAQRHDLTLVSEHHPEALESVLAGREITQSSVQEYKQASRVLAEQETKLIEQLMVTSVVESTAPLKQKLDEISAEIDRQQQREPTPVLIKTAGFKQTHAEWAHKINVLKAAHDNVSRAIESQQTGRGFEMTLDAVKKEAEKMVSEQWPNERKIVADFKADQEVTQLIGKVNELDREIAAAKTVSDTKQLPRLLKRKERALNRLKDKKSVFERLTGKQQLIIKKAVLDTKKALSLSKDRGLDLGR